MTTKSAPQDYIAAIKASSLTIYDPIEVGDPHLWIPSSELENILNAALRGVSLAGLPLRTRSKVVKTKVCEALGYPVPASFKKTQPRFPGQCFDTYAQKSNNLQVWNEDISPVRRYVLLQVNVADTIEKVRVVDGATLALLDTTGTLTQKYQARLVHGAKNIELISSEDTAAVRKITQTFDPEKLKTLAPTDHPEQGTLMPISTIFERLSPLVGKSFVDTGVDQERNRGTVLHKMASEALGYSSHKDNGRFPDIANQLLEVKLQMSPTIDLGVVTPSSDEALDTPQISGEKMKHHDVRYVLFGAKKDGNKITLTSMYLVTGEDFFSRFPRFEGKVLNKKLQIPLPSDFFSATPKAA